VSREEEKSPRALPVDLAPLYVEIRSPAAIWTARRECAEAIRRGEADSLFRGRPRGAPRTASGRGPMTSLLLDGRPAVGKRALHGGLAGPLVGRLYFGRRRALDQLRAAVRLERSGIPTPTVLAVGSARVFGPLCAQAIVTRELEGAQNLYEVAEGAPGRDRRRQILLLCAGLLRRLHDAGYLHADLNVGNLVLERGAAGETLHVVDLDRGRFRSVVTPEERLGNLARLLRSYEKWIAGRLRLSRSEELCFLRSYAGGDRAQVRFLAKGLSRYRSRLGLRRIRWRLAADRSSGDRPTSFLQ
jgi:hypothetical protein